MITLFLNHFNLKFRVGPMERFDFFTDFLMIYFLNHYKDIFIFLRTCHFLLSSLSTEEYQSFLGYYWFVEVEGGIWEK